MLHFTHLIFTAGNSSFGKVMFSQVSVDLFTMGWWGGWVGGVRVSLVPGPFLVPGPIFFPVVRYLWFYAPSRGQGWGVVYLGDDRASRG